MHWGYGCWWQGRLLSWAVAFFRFLLYASFSSFFIDTKDIQQRKSSTAELMLDEQGIKQNHMHHIHEIWCGHVTIPNHKSTLPSLCHYAANIVLSCVQKTKLLLVTHFGAGGIKARQKNKWPKLVFKKHRSKRPVSYLQIDFGLPLTGVWSKYKRDIGIIRNDFRVTSEKFAQNNLHTSIWFNLIKLKLLRKLLN
jgi:hypothetical protein